MKSCVISGLLGTALAAPFSFPLSNGFPNLSPAALALVQKQAGGTLPNVALPKDITKDLAVSFALIAANEIFEVAYFTELYNNITNHVPGYEVNPAERQAVESALHRIRAQEELHATAANAVLKTNNVPTIAPCKYEFPVNNYASAIKLANTFTDVVLGVLPVVQVQSATDGGPEGVNLVPIVGSIEEQEAQQVGWFRTQQGKDPSAAPFLTPTTPEFALSAIKLFLVPGSCPSTYNAIEAAVASFPPLTVTAAPSPSSQKASFSVTGAISCDEHELAYISGQNTPVAVPITNVRSAKGVTTFDAAFPADKSGFADGLTVAAVVKQSSSGFASPAAVAKSTVYGPGLIEYQ